MENPKFLPDWQEWLFDHAWIAEALIILSVLFGLNFLLKKILFRFKQIAHLNENDWRTHLDYAAILPARCLLWTLLIPFLIDLLARELHLGKAFYWVEPLRNMGIVILLAWFSLRWKKVFYNAMAAQRVKGKPSFDPVSMEILGKVFTIGVLFVSLLVILQLFGLDIIPLITFGGIGAAALGFAGRDVIANFFGGFMIYMTRPFTIQDLVEIPEKKVIGHIEEIGWYLTTIRDLHKKPVYIPNSVFSTGYVVNLSRITHRRIEETISLRHADRALVYPIIEEIRSLLERHPEIDQHQPVDVYLLALAPYALRIEIKAYTLSTRYEEFMEIKQKILLAVYQIITHAGAEIPSAR